MGELFQPLLQGRRILGEGELLLNPLGSGIRAGDGLLELARQPPGDLADHGVITHVGDHHFTQSVHNLGSAVDAAGFVGPFRFFQNRLGPFVNRF